MAQQLNLSNEQKLQAKTYHLEFKKKLDALKQQ